MVPTIPSIIQGNVRGLGSYDRHKILTLARLAVDHNSIAIALTESHLSSEIEDSEINIEGWSLFRGDRSNRNCGGSIIYIKERLPVSNKLSFSNDYCDISALYLSDRNVAIVSLYRPPQCPTQKFLEALVFVDKWLKVLEASYESPNIYITVDFNLKFLEDWNLEIIQSYIDLVVNRVSENLSVADDKIQAQNLIAFTEKWNLTQCVKEPTRESNILDLIFVNSDDMITNIEYIVNSRFSDHSLLVSRVKMDNINERDVEKKSFCDSDIPLYNLHDNCEDRWVKANDWLSNCELNDIELSDFNTVIENMIKANFVEKKRDNLKNDGKEFRSKELFSKRK